MQYFELFYLPSGLFAVKYVHIIVFSSTGYIDYLPASENLVAQINRSCNLLLKHVQTAINRTLSALDEVDLQKSTHSYKEVCTYVRTYACLYAAHSVYTLLWCKGI